MGTHLQQSSWFFQKVPVRHHFVSNCTEPTLHQFICCDWTIFGQVKCMSPHFLNQFDTVAGESLSIICNRISQRFHTCVVFNAASGFSSLNLQPKSFAGQRSRLWQTADHPTCIHLFSRSTLSVSLAFCEEKGKERQIRLLPQKLPITAWQCVQHRCLANAEFVNPVQRQGICELNFEAVVLNESSAGARVSERIA